VFAQKRELDELRIKVRLLETRHNEDAERIRTLEKKETDADQLHAVRAKLQAKFQEQQSTLATAQREARDIRSQNKQLETRALETLDQLELATLDREVAEEKAEAAEADVQRLNGKIEELELELAVLKEENGMSEEHVG
jgi:dynactin 1